MKATYRDICSHKTGHAEAVQVEFEVYYENLLDVFWSIHNHTTENRQGWDTGSQYRWLIVILQNLNTTIIRLYNRTGTTSRKVYTSVGLSLALLQAVGLSLQAIVLPTHSNGDISIIIPV